MRALLLVAAATLALSACSRDADEAEEANALTADNMAVDENLALNGMNADVNALDPATQNMINQDLNTNDPDTNLANGM